MKTKKRTFRKLAKVAFIALVTFGIQSCETEIPITDTIDPAFSFQIKGDGFDETFNQDTDFSRIQLNLRDNTRYDFTLTGTDSGGVALIQWQADTGGNIIFETPVDRPWTSIDISPLSRMIEWRGNRNDPYTGSIITGSFRANGGNVYPVFRFFVRDFGGERGVANSSDGELRLFIGNHSTEIRRF